MSAPFLSTGVTCSQTRPSGSATAGAAIKQRTAQAATSSAALRAARGSRERSNFDTAASWGPKTSLISDGGDHRRRRTRRQVTAGELTHPAQPYCVFSRTAPETRTFLAHHVSARRRARKRLEPGLHGRIWTPTGRDEPCQAAELGARCRGVLFPHEPVLH